MRKTPQSRFEKLYAGMKLLMQYQPAAQVDAKEGMILFGNADDPHIPKGARDYLGKLGFTTQEVPSTLQGETYTFFAFPVHNEKNQI